MQVYIGRHALTKRKILKDQAAKPDQTPAEGDVSAMPGDIVRFPRHASEPRCSEELKERLLGALSRRANAPHVLPAEYVTILAVDLPVSGARARMSAAPFAVEERVAAPLGDTHVAVGPVVDPSLRARRLVGVVSRDQMDKAASNEDRPILSELMAIPRPDPPSSGFAWSVWREGSRALVRASDGTGFAARSDMLPLLWERAGKPVLTSLGSALPGAMQARDLSDAPPPPDSGDLRFDLRQGEYSSATGQAWRALRQVAAILIVGAISHLGLLAADVTVLRQVAEDERAVAQRAVDPVLSGVAIDALTADALLARLAPEPPTGKQDRMLPFLSDISAVLLSAGGDVTFERLAYSDAQDTLTLQLRTRGLEALQHVETGLKAAGYSVESGAATAGEDGAEAQMILRQDG